MPFRTLLVATYTVMVFAVSFRTRTAIPAVAGNTTPVAVPAVELVTTVSEAVMAVAVAWVAPAAEMLLTVCNWLCTDNVGAVTVPVKVGDASGARDVSVGCTWSARANVVPVPAAPVPFIVGVVLLA